MSQIFRLETHPDADSLNAFAENALPEAQRQELLAHIGVCQRCRKIILLARQAELDFSADMKSTPFVRYSPERKNWFERWRIAWIAGAALTASIVLTIFVYSRHSALREVRSVEVAQVPAGRQTNIPPSDSSENATAKAASIPAHPVSPEASTEKLKSAPLQGRNSGASEPVASSAASQANDRHLATDERGVEAINPIPPPPTPPANPLILGARPAATPPQGQSRWVVTSPLPANRFRGKNIAVLDFGYATVMSASQAVFGTNVDIGKGISELLVDQLGNTYRIVGRSELDKILHEQGFSNSDRADPNTAAKIGHILGVDAVITGDITQFGRDDKNQNYGASAVGAWTHGAFGGVGKHESKAVVVITVRMVDATSGEILASVTGKGESTRSGTSLLGGGYGNGSGGAAGYDMSSSNFAQTIIGEATNAAVAQVATRLNADASKILNAPPPAKVAVSGLVADASAMDSVIINVGGSAGVKVGDKLTILRVVRTVNDPTTGRPLHTIESPIGTLTITSVDAGSAVGTFSGSVYPRIGDSVKSPE